MILGCGRKGGEEEGGGALWCGVGGKGGGGRLEDKQWKRAGEYDLQSYSKSVPRVDLSGLSHLGSTHI